LRSKWSNDASPGFLKLYGYRQIIILLLKFELWILIKKKYEYPIVAV